MHLKKMAEALGMVHMQRKGLNRNVLFDQMEAPVPEIMDCSL
jgi:hypothetical protein